MKKTYISIGLLIFGVIALLTSFAFFYSSIQYEINQTIHESGIDFSISPHFVWSRSGCVTAEWQLANINTVYINGELTTDASQREFCRPFTPELLINHPNGETSNLSLEIEALSTSRAIQLGLFLAMLSFVFSVFVWRGKDTYEVRSKGFKAHAIHFPWHVFILIIYLLLYGYAQNTELFVLAQVLTLTLYFLLATLLFYALLRWIIGARRANLITLVFAVSFLIYGHLYGLLLLKYPEYVQLFPIAYIIFTLVIVGLLLVARYDFLKINHNLNIIALIMIVISMITQFIPQQFLDQTSGDLGDIYDPFNLTIEIPTDSPEPLPDIYYLIFDGYPSNSYLETHFGIDNSYFTDELEERGFYVAPDTNANYTYTYASVSSTLNMDYVHNFAPLDEDIGISVLEPYLANSRVARIFQNIGYDYVYIANGFSAYKGIIADTVVDVTLTGQIVHAVSDGVLDSDYAENTGKRSFWQYIIQTTLLRLIDPTLTEFSGNFHSAAWYAPERIFMNFNALNDVPARDEPTFTYFHIVKPHLPITMNAAGERFDWTNIYSNEADYFDNQEIHFEDQLIFLNQKIIESIDEILNQSDTPPIIIVQADHGAELSRVRFDLSNNPLPILNAYYFPDGDYSNLSPDITPVNSFRVILNQFFGEDYPYLDNQSYYQPQNRLRLLTFEPIAEGVVEPPFEQD